MTQFHFLDDSGDPGLTGDAGSSRHFVLAMVQLPQRCELTQLRQLRRSFHWPADSEIKYYRMKPRQKDAFFSAAQNLPFKARVVYLDKARMPDDLANMNGQDLTIELITRLVMRVPELDLANDALIVDGATRAFRQALRAYEFRVQSCGARSPVFCDTGSRLKV